MLRFSLEKSSTRSRILLSILFLLTADRDGNYLVFGGFPNFCHKFVIEIFSPIKKLEIVETETFSNDFHDLRWYYPFLC